MNLDRRDQLVVALLTALALGIGALVLQRWVAQTFQVAVALVVAWFGIVTAVAYLYQRDRPDMRLATLGTIGLVGIVSAIGGYWTGIRKDEVNETVAVASARASGEARIAALAGTAPGGSGAEEQSSKRTGETPQVSSESQAEAEPKPERSSATAESDPEPSEPSPTATDTQGEQQPMEAESDVEESGSSEKSKDPRSTPDPEEPEIVEPVELASGSVEGADGHAGEGVATIVDEGDGKRTLTLTDFDVDAGPDVNVYLSESTDGIERAIDIGDLKAERGTQAYEIPADVDLNRYGDLVLWCIPFTTRIATAELR